LMSGRSIRSADPSSMIWLISSEKHPTQLSCRRGATRVLPPVAVVPATASSPFGYRTAFIRRPPNVTQARFHWRTYWSHGAGRTSFWSFSYAARKRGRRNNDDRGSTRVAPLRMGTQRPPEGRPLSMRSLD
jgi:hypothetical protein